MRLCPPDPSPTENGDAAAGVPRCTGCGTGLPKPRERGGGSWIATWIAMEVSVIVLMVFIAAAELPLLAAVALGVVLMHVWMFVFWCRLVRCRQCRKWQFGLRPVM